MFGEQLSLVLKNLLCIISLLYAYYYKSGSIRGRLYYTGWLNSETGVLRGKGHG